MNIQYIDLLTMQKELYDAPRDRARFEQYLKAMRGSADEGVEFSPLSLINPMAREHVKKTIQDLVDLDAHGVAEKAIVECAQHILSTSGPWQIGIVIGDDAQGGWTNRYDYEFKIRFGDPRMEHRKQPTSGWLSAVIWSSESVDERTIRESIMIPILRQAYQDSRGRPTTLRERMLQEGCILKQTNAELVRWNGDPVELSAEELEYTIEILSPYAEATDFPTTVAAFFGDDAAESLGFPKLGIEPWAGMALSLHLAHDSP